MDLQIEYTNEFPESLKASAEKCLRNGITFLESIPRPTTHGIEYLTPDFENMKFQFGENVWSHGLFSRQTMAGWCVMAYRSNGDLLINSTPCWTVAGVDPEIASTASIVYVLDQYFVKVKHPEQHLLRQIQYLDWLSGKDARAKSLVDQWEEHKAQQDQAGKDEEYQQQIELKRYLAARKHAHDTALRLPLWWLERWPNSPQSLEGEFIVTTSGGHPIGTHVEWRSGQLSAPAPAPNVAAQQAMQSKEPEPFVPSTAEEDAEAFMQMQSAATGHASPTSCEDYDR